MAMVMFKKKIHTGSDLLLNVSLAGGQLLKVGEAIRWHLMSLLQGIMGYLIIK